MAVPEMTAELHWRSKRGRRTDDNWDYCGVGFRSEATLCVVLDGSSRKPKSGELVRLVAKDLIDWFVQTEGQVSSDEIIGQMHIIHDARLPNLQQASASYLIMLITRYQAPIIFHAGDCLFGNVDTEGLIEWLMQPHTLANATCDLSIAKLVHSNIRNRLTRSLRANEFMTPEITTIPAKQGETLIVATDGFWAGLNQEEQRCFLVDEGCYEGDDLDDCSALKITINDAVRKPHVTTTTPDNLYVVIST
ncbi:protein phosphatase 2C domain-containing protein [uncultured Tateyamaria sp.]|uniref:protein phosphatase 2C domain-containing protein n=1 Tax=uncultured Tateyamaria sp. TaxID=455651 RepID=UPI0026017989|nr:protein phosphatase 2C domain-containing protein [uncultured Tateyamaria sp.]